MTKQKSEEKNSNDVEHGNVVMNQVIDAVKVGVPAVAGFALTVAKGVPKVIKLIKR